MKANATVVMGLVAALSGAGAFVVGRLGAEATAAPGPAIAAVHGGDEKDALATWLGYSADQRKQVTQADPNCEHDVHVLKVQLQSQRQALAQLLVRPSPEEGEVLRQMQAVARIQDQLECRVARHIFLIRSQLSEQQARKLMTLAAGEVLQPHGWQGISSCCLEGTCKCLSHHAPAEGQ